VTHTPGPWYASPYSSIVGIAISGASGVIAGIRGDRPAAEANARLIAVAPDLLALAKQYASECGDCGGTGVALVATCDQSKDFGAVPQQVPCDVCADIRAVINKAEEQT